MKTYPFPKTRSSLFSVLALICLLFGALTLSGCDAARTENADEPDPGTLLLTGPANNAILSWTEAGDEVLLRRSEDSGWRIDAINPSTGTSRIIAEALTFERAELTPGASVPAGGALFMHTGWGRGLGHRNAIDRLDLATGDVTRLAELGEDNPLNLVATPDGEYLYYTLQLVDTNLRRLDVATRTETGIATIPASDFGHPYFSPQADRFVYITGDTGQTNPDAEAHLAHVETGPVARMGFTGRALDVVWPGGDPHLVYLRHGSGEPDVLHIQPMEGAGTTLTAALPRWDERGRRLPHLRNEPTSSSFAIDLDARRMLYPRNTLDRLYIMAYDLRTGEQRAIASHRMGIPHSSDPGAVGEAATVDYIGLGADRARLVYKIRSRLYTLDVNER